MSYRITIVELVRVPTTEDAPPKFETLERYQQTVDALDLKLVMQAVNHVPRKPRVRKVAEAAQ